MKMSAKTIMPCLWFDTQAEAAANHYVSIFENSRIRSVSRFGSEGKEIHGKDNGTVMTVEFEIEGQRFVALNGGPQFTFDEAISFQIHCETQEEVDYFSTRLADGGEQGPCGWVKDKFGLSWQVTPAMLPELLMNQDRTKADRVMKAMLKMRKIDIAALKQAAA